MPSEATVVSAFFFFGSFFYRICLNFFVKIYLNIIHLISFEAMLVGARASKLHWLGGNGHIARNCALICVQLCILLNIYIYIYIGMLFWSSCPLSCKSYPSHLILQVIPTMWRELSTERWPMSYSSTSTSFSHNNGMEGEVMSSRPIGWVCKLLIKKKTVYWKVEKGWSLH